MTLMLLCPALALPSVAACSDLGRPREYLERFDLASLRYISREATRDGMVAIVVDPTGRHHRVKAGSFLGKDYGRVSVVKTAEILLVELHPDGSGGWYEHIAAIPVAPEP